MALMGTGAICIWNDITPEGRAEFYDWHLNEHMPERAAIPGFLRSRRFIATAPDTTPEFFTLYETADTAVLTGEAYLARLNAPTDWTKRATQAFRNTSRALTQVFASAGPGSGGVLATLRLAVREGEEEAAMMHLKAGITTACALPRVAAAHACRTNDTASAARTTESKDRADILTAPPWVVMVEACDEAAARVGLSAAIEPAAALLAGEGVIGVYSFEYAC